MAAVATAPMKAWNSGMPVRGEEGVGSRTTTELPPRTTEAERGAPLIVAETE